MSKRNAESELEGPSAKARREEADDGGSGRTGRVRKKSAKVLEMEEFEQVEKTQSHTKKSKTPKGVIKSQLSSAPEEEDTPVIAAPTPVTVTKLKGPLKIPAGLTPKMALAATLMQTPIAVTPAGAAPSASKSSKSSKSQDKPEDDVTKLLAAVVKKERMEASSPVKGEKSQSVIKYLLSSPSSGSKPALEAPDSGSEPVGGTSKRSTTKKIKGQEKPSSNVKAAKSKAAKVKLELGSEEDDDGGDDKSLRPGSKTGLKMTISAGSDPQAASVTLNSETAAEITGKGKKQSKKSKAAAAAGLVPVETAVKIETEDGDTSPTAKKSTKKLSKKKQKLIENAILAAASQQSASVSPTPLEDEGKHSKKKKKKKKVKIADQPSDLYESKLELDIAEEESNLVIAETEKTKKKTFKKKKSLKGKGSPADAKPEEEKTDKKLSKRAPTAYMLFCNSHRGAIVSENPGIEFAAISRKLGELWQTLSTKQKLQWRRKAQRRMKRGSNLISTGKTVKEAVSAQGSSTSAATATPGAVQTLAGNAAAAVRYINAVRSPVDTPQSPTKLNFSIEPVDVAAHLKLLGESLSIIGMRLQEHKGMIAVQGSLSVLLDSLLCACGPLLCLTQQVPDMDGCDPLVHGQTLDSVAYVMPGL